MRKPRVIIIDDDLIYLDLMKLYFTNWGYEVFAYNTPAVCPLNKDLSDACSSLSPCADILISDFKMPVMSGIELLQQQSKKGCKIDVRMKAIISGFSDEEIITSCKDLGCRYFQKPFSFSELSGWLKKCEQFFDFSRQLSANRSEPRYEFIEAIEYSVNPLSSPEKYIGITVNKSMHGLGIRVFNALHAKQEIRIIKGLEVTNLLGTVMWCNKGGENIYNAGLRLAQAHCSP